MPGEVSSRPPKPITYQRRYIKLIVTFFKYQKCRRSVELLLWPAAILNREQQLSKINHLRVWRSTSMAAFSAPRPAGATQLLTRSRGGEPEAYWLVARSSSRVRRQALVFKPRRVVARR